MGVYIKDTEMPKVCSDCFAERCIGSDFGCDILGFDDANTTCFTKERRKDCPLVPAVEMRPVIRATWKVVKYPLYECSNCDAVYKDVEYRLNFCPNCGAMMEDE